MTKADLTILVVEDHPPSREALKMSLEDWSYEVHTAPSGRKEE